MYSSLKACSTVAFVHANKIKIIKKGEIKKTFWGMLEQRIPSLAQTNTDMVTCTEEVSQRLKSGLGFKVFGSNSYIGPGEKQLIFFLPLSKKSQNSFLLVITH